MGACLAEASVTLTERLFGVLRTTDVMIKTADTKPKVNDKERQTVRSVSKQHKSSINTFDSRATVKT